MKAMSAGIDAIAYYLPDQTLDNDELAELYPDWTAEKISAKTGIESRHIAAQNETAGDMAEKAALRLFAESELKPEMVDFIILATQSPDYFLPTTACMLQEKLGIPETAGAFDYNLGCSAYIYGLAIAKGLICAGIAENILLITSETYSKYIHPLDKSTRTIFGDGAAATWISPNGVGRIGEFDLGTRGAGSKHLIVPAGAARLPHSLATAEVKADENDSARSQDHIFMDGPEIFNFTIDVVPKTMEAVLDKNGIGFDAIDLFVFHQANKFMLDFLRNKIKAPKEKFYVDMADTGNTVSASIPIALKRAMDHGQVKAGFSVLLAGFGVGLSWGSVVLDFKEENYD